MVQLKILKEDSIKGHFHLRLAKRLETKSSSNSHIIHSFHIAQIYMSSTMHIVHHRKYQIVPNLQRNPYTAQNVG